MAKRIAIFNHKGGVGKTTLTFHLGWMLASKGKRVIMVDADPQCNLTGLVLGPEQMEEFSKNSNCQNLKEGLRPAFRNQFKLIEPVECQTVTNDLDGLFLLPGYLGLSEYETSLAVAQSLGNILYPLENLPGAFSYLFNQTAKQYQADYILIDMNPSLGAINQNLLMTSDYFIIPLGLDYFSIMAIESMGVVLPQWSAWANKLMSLPNMTDEATYPLPQVTPKLLGVIVQRFHTTEGKPSAGHQKWIDDIYQLVLNKLMPILTNCDMVLPAQVHQEVYKKIRKKKKLAAKDQYLYLAQIPDFGTFNSVIHADRVPVFTIADDGLTEIQIANRNTLKEHFTRLADSIIELTRYERQH
jgi:cellulose biosynthesis protein BcsQ